MTAARRLPLLERPRTRADCADGPRPCPWVSCPHHLYVDVSPRTGALEFRYPGRELAELEESCALDVAERGGAALEDVAEVVGVSRERLRMDEARALAKLRAKAERMR